MSSPQCDLADLALALQFSAEYIIRRVKKSARMESNGCGVGGAFSFIRHNGKKTRAREPNE